MSDQRTLSARECARLAIGRLGVPTVMADIVMDELAARGFSVVGKPVKRLSLDAFDGELHELSVTVNDEILDARTVISRCVLRDSPGWGREHVGRKLAYELREVVGEKLGLPC